MISYLPVKGCRICLLSRKSFKRSDKEFTLRDDRTECVMSIRSRTIGICERNAIEMFEMWREMVHYADGEKIYISRTMTRNAVFLTYIKRCCIGWQPNNRQDVYMLSSVIDVQEAAIKEGKHWVTKSMVMIMKVMWKATNYRMMQHMLILIYAKRMINNMLRMQSYELLMKIKVIPTWNAEWSFQPDTAHASHDQINSGTNHRTRRATSLPIITATSSSSKKIGAASVVMECVSMPCPANRTQI